MFCILHLLSGRRIPAAARATLWFIGGMPRARLARYDTAAPRALRLAVAVEELSGRTCLAAARAAARRPSGEHGRVDVTEEMTRCSRRQHGRMTDQMVGLPR